MLQEGTRAPAFTAPMATPENAVGRGEYTAENVVEFDLERALEAGPVVLAFFPGVFSRTCTRELCQMRDWIADLTELDALGGREDEPHERGVFGVSVDPPWPQLAFIDEHDISYPLLSGFNTDLVRDFDVRSTEGILAGLAIRSVFVLAPDRTVEYAWATEEPLTFPDLEAIEAAVEWSA